MHKEKHSQWRGGLIILEEFQDKGHHLDRIFEKMDRDTSVYWLAMLVFRGWFLFEKRLEGLVKKRPDRRVERVMRLAVAEMDGRDQEKWGQVVHYAVRFGRHVGLSERESAFVNACLRKMAQRMSEETERNMIWLTHPAWLVDRWTAAFGKKETRKLLEWNQSPGQIYLKVGGGDGLGSPTQWEGYEKIESSRIKELGDLLESGELYIQDPFARIPVDLAGSIEGQRIYDLCAAPGGKSHLLSQRMGEKGHLTSIDKPGKRLERLAENLAGSALAGTIDVVGLDLLQMGEDEQGIELIKDGADVVLIDVPCSNTGVIQKRPDVKIRLGEKQLKELQQLQIELLLRASECVRRGGKLIYSTCSLEPEENIEVVDALIRMGGWELVEKRLSYPWRENHDGGGAFLLRRLKD